MPINPTTSATDWRKTVKVVSLTVLAVMATAAIVLPPLSVVAVMAFAG